MGGVLMMGSPIAIIDRAEIDAGKMF